jgi:hypothetical protein
MGAQIARSVQFFPVRLARAFARATRVLAYAVVVTAVLGFFGLKSVRGQIGEKTFGLGREMAPFMDLLSGTHRVVLNGEPLYVASAVTAQPMSVVLDRFEAQCRAHTGGLVEELDALPATAKAEVARRAPTAWNERSGVWREERETEGSITCVERSDGHGLTDTVQALKTFMATGDVHALGNFRYVYVRPTDHGKTHVLSTFTEGEFNVFKVIGRGAKEPAGTDPAETPRLPDASRMVSAEVDGDMYGTYIFASSAPVEQALGFYEVQLQAHGWKYVVGHSDIGVQVWQRDGVTMVVNAVRPDGDDKTRLTFSQGRTVAARGSK